MRLVIKMVTYSDAFSIELGRNITAQEANELYTGKKWDGSTIKAILKSKKSFQCSENCTFPLTCANVAIDFSKSENFEKHVQPYFTNKIPAKHSFDCLRNQKSKTTQEKVKRKFQTYLQDTDTLKINMDMFEGLIHPTEEKSQQIEATIDTEISNTNSRAKYSNNATSRTVRRIRTMNSLPNLVEYYELVTSNSMTPKKLIGRDNQLLKLEDIFVDLSKSRKIDSLARIYLGQAHAELKVLKDGTRAVKITFSKKICFKGIWSRSSVLVFESDFESNKKLYEELLIYAENWNSTQRKTKENYFQLYFWGKFFVNGPYINFKKNKQTFSKSLYIKRNL